MTELILMARGRDADVYALDDGRVLRRYRGAGDVAAEAALMTYLGRRDFPVPLVHAADGTDLILERLDGPTMLSALADGTLDATAAARVMVRLQDALHRVPPRDAAQPDDRILHLDLHPDNIMLSSRGPVLIDWRNAREGPPALDVALSAVILAQVAADETGGLAPAAGELLTAFLDASTVDPTPELDRAVAMRQANPTMSAAERGLLGAAAALIRSHRRHADRV